MCVCMCVCVNSSSRWSEISLFPILRFESYSPLMFPWRQQKKYDGRGVKSRAAAVSEEEEKERAKKEGNGTKLTSNEIIVHR